MKKGIWQDKAILWHRVCSKPQQKPIKQKRYGNKRKSITMGRRTQRIV